MIDWADLARRIDTRNHRRWTEIDLAAYETRICVRLPDALRELYLHVGERGALLPLDYEAEVRRFAIGWGKDPAGAAKAMVGRFDRPFPFSDAWNVGVDDPDELAPDATTENARRYWQPLDGAFPFAEVCDIQDTIVVVTGEARGTVWRDARISCDGLLPWRTIDGSRMTIDVWAELFVQSLVSGGSMIRWRPEP